MKYGKQLLTELHDLSPVPVYIRAHHLLTSGRTWQFASAGLDSWEYLTRRLIMLARPMALSPRYIDLCTRSIGNGRIVRRRYSWCSFR